MAQTADRRDWWTDQRVDELRRRWADHQTASQICRVMGAASRHAVIGKAYRLKLATRAKPGGTKSTPKKRRNYGQRPTKPNGAMTRHHIDGLVFITRGEQPVIEEKPTAFKHPKLFPELEACDCHWPGAGEPGPDLWFCADPVLKGFSYCPRHCRIAYQRPSHGRRQ